LVSNVNGAGIEQFLGDQGRYPAYQGLGAVREKNGPTFSYQVLQSFYL
jgi:hypothetical protein